MTRGKRRITTGCLFLIGLLWLGGCGSPSSDPAPPGGEGEAGSKTASAAFGESAAEAPELVYEDSLELRFAENFSVDHYQGGYTRLALRDGTEILVVPEDGEIPAGVGEGVIVLRRPIRNLYLVASASMDLFDALGAVDAVTLSGQKEEGWYIASAREAMAEGKMLYAGKYNQPDYERIVSQGCTLAIENHMISHAPEVVEMLESFGIPVMIDDSSYEPHPLGRGEWIKFYGALLGEEEKAEQIFAEQTDILERVTAEERTDQTVAFFYITSNGMAQVRQSSDYVPKVIELAGGRYIFDGIGDPDSHLSTTNLQLEEFYSGARDADFLIYNSSIDGGVSSLEELLDKCALLEDFRAVQEGRVFCTSDDLYQQSLSIGYLMEDIHRMLLGEETGFHFLVRLT